MVAKSVEILRTTPNPVIGNVHEETSLGTPCLVQCRVTAQTSRVPATKSIAPPTAGIASSGPVDQLAKSPSAETCMAPRTQISMCPPPDHGETVGLVKIGCTGSGGYRFFPRVDQFRIGLIRLR